MIFQPSKDRLIRALSERSINKIIKIGQLTQVQRDSINEIRIDKGWPPKDSLIITIGHNDILHMLKRIDDDGLTPEEVGLLAEYTLHDDSVVISKDNRAILEYPELIDFGEGSFRAQGVLMDSYYSHAPRLFGVIPKGWGGRK